MEKKTKKIPKSSRRPFSDITNKRFGDLTAVFLSHRENHKTFWSCLCKCGKTKIITYTLLMSGKVKSCGCKTKYLRSINPKFNNPLKSGQSCFNHLFLSYSLKAKKRNLSFNINKEDFYKLTQQNCTYCESVPNSIRTLKGSNGDYIYNGLDRIDNNLGYELSNVVACCKTCNMMKQTLSVKQLIEHIKLVLQVYEKNQKIAIARQLVKG